jgi:hypothetical protein
MDKKNRARSVDFGKALVDLSGPDQANCVARWHDRRPGFRSCLGRPDANGHSDCGNGNVHYCYESAPGRHFMLHYSFFAISLARKRPTINDHSRHSTARQTLALRIDRLVISTWLLEKGRNGDVSDWQVRPVRANL